MYIEIKQKFYSNNFLLRMIRTMKIVAHVHSLLFEGILINCYPLVYFLLIVSVRETVISSTILDALYASTKKKQSHVYSLSCPLTCIIHGCSCLQYFEYFSMICSPDNRAIYTALASHLPKSSDILGYAVAIYTVGDFCFFHTN